MKSRIACGGTVLILVGLAATASAQVPEVVRGPEADKLRTQMAIMESFLERAVNEGVRGTLAQIPEAASAPIMLGGTPRARGFKVNGFGLFFDVEVPVIPPTMMWSLQVMSRNSDAAILKDLGDMRTLLAQVSDPKVRAEMQQRLRNVEARVSGVPPEQQASGAAAQPQPGMARRVANERTVAAAPPAPAKSPDEMYTEEVQKALVKAILDQGVMLELAPEETLTVAARGSEGPRTNLLDDADVATMYLTIQGKDLIALRSGKMSRDEAAKAIKIHHF